MAGSGIGLCEDEFFFTMAFARGSTEPTCGASGASIPSPPGTQIVGP